MSVKVKVVRVDKSTTNEVLVGFTFVCEISFYDDKNNKFAEQFYEVYIPSSILTNSSDAHVLRMLKKTIEDHIRESGESLAESIRQKFEDREFELFVEEDVDESGYEHEVGE